MIIIGIDPDLVKSGYALIINNEIRELKSLPFPKLIDEILCLDKNKVLIILEDVESNKPIFKRNVNRLVELKIAQNVGQVKAAQRLIKEFLESYGYQVLLCKPLKGSIKKAKDDKKYFNQITGWNKSSNQDKRDAALLALYGDYKK